MTRNCGRKDHRKALGRTKRDKGRRVRVSAFMNSRDLGMARRVGVRARPGRVGTVTGMPVGSRSQESQKCITTNKERPQHPKALDLTTAWVHTYTGTVIAKR